MAASYKRAGPPMWLAAGLGACPETPAQADAAANRRLAASSEMPIAANYRHLLRPCQAWFSGAPPALEFPDRPLVGARAERLLELHHLHGDLDHEPVLLAQVEAGELHDSSQALAERVRVHVEGLRGGADVAAAAQELLERPQERGLALAVVLGEAGDGVAVRVAHARVEGHAQEVLVRPELLVGHDARLPLQPGRAEEGVAGFLEAGGDGGGAPARTRDAHGGLGPALEPADLFDEQQRVAGREPQERAHRVVAPVE